MSAILSAQAVPRGGSTDCASSTSQAALSGTHSLKVPTSTLFSVRVSKKGGS